MASGPSTGRILVVLSILLALAGCGQRERRVSVEQPIEFSHKKHFEYFASGEHREEKIRMHLEILGGEEPPEELAQGKCLECHDDLAQEVPACAGCHSLFQDAALRERSEIRPCVGCHRQAWTGWPAGIPSANVCRACHGPDPITGAPREPLSESPKEATLLGYLGRGEDIPWMRITTSNRHVHFSHASHVHLAGFACTRCHADVRGLDEPPDVATIFTMDACMECHREGNASTDCLTCHK